MAVQQQFIIATFGSAGDVYPFLGVGAELARRGHDVTLLSFHEYQAAARAAGIDFVPIGRWSQVEAQLAAVDVKDWRRMVKLLSRITTEHMAETYYAIAERAHSETTLVSFVTALGAQFASERFDLPHAALQLTPAVFRSPRAAPRFGSAKLTPGIRRTLAPLMYGLLDHVFDRELGATANAFRRQVGLPPLKSVRRVMDSPDMMLGLFPEWFAPKQSDWPQWAHTSDFPLYDPSDGRPLAFELESFLSAGTPPIAFTAGTPTQGYGPFYEAAVAACNKLERRGLLLTRYPSDLPRYLPDTIVHVPYAPFSKLLPRVAALVHHGGIGTTAQALRAGIPQLVVPWGIDQFDNAKWVERLGVGRELSANRATANKLASTLGGMLSDTAVLARCASVAERFHGSDPFDVICTRLESLSPAGARSGRLLRFRDAPSERASITQQAG